METPALVLFARAPEPGRVKTRLSPALGTEGSALLYRAFLEDAARGYLWSGVWTSVLAADPDAAHPMLTALFPRPWRRESQAPGGLSERLSEAFAREAALGSPQTVAVGSDHPALPRALMRTAFNALANGSDAVVIPAEDGGFCALGLSRTVDPDEVFRDIPWSTAAVMERTLQRLHAVGASVAVLETFYDVDRPEDVARLFRDLAARDPEAEDFPRATARALRRLEEDGWRP